MDEELNYLDILYGNVASNDYSWENDDDISDETDDVDVSTQDFEDDIVEYPSENTEEEIVEYETDSWRSIIYNFVTPIEIATTGDELITAIANAIEGISEILKKEGFPNIIIISKREFDELPYESKHEQDEDEDEYIYNDDDEIIIDEIEENNYKSSAKNIIYFIEDY